MFCAKCGAEVSEQHAFCAKCGSPDTIPPASESSHSFEPGAESAGEPAMREGIAVTQAQQFQHKMVFVKREGNKPVGEMWAAFLQEQQRILDDYGSRGWQLVATVPVLKVTLEGVLLYFTSPPGEAPRPGV